MCCICETICECIGLVLWWILGGIILAFFWAFLGVLMIPFAICCQSWCLQCWKAAGVCLYPQGWRVEHGPICCDQLSCSCLGNLIWLFTVGWVLFLTHMFFFLIFYIFECCNINLSNYHYELAMISLAPFNSKMDRK